MKNKGSLSGGFLNQVLSCWSDQSDWHDHFHWSDQQVVHPLEPLHQGPKSYPTPTRLPSQPEGGGFWIHFRAHLLHTSTKSIPGHPSSLPPFVALVFVGVGYESALSEGRSCEDARSLLIQHGAKSFEDAAPDLERSANAQLAHPPSLCVLGLNWRL